MNMTKKDMKELSLELMKCSEAVFFSTINNEGFPNIRAMNNLRNTEQFARLIPFFESHDEDFMILFSTNTSSEKVSHIQKNSKVSAYFKKPGVWQGVTFIGEVEVVKDPEIIKAIWHPDWVKFYPNGMFDEDHTVLRIFPTRAKGWNSEAFTTFKFTIR